MVLRSLRQKWFQYRYRFVPWIVLNLKERTVRSVKKDDTDKIITDEVVHSFLLRFFSVLDEKNNKSDVKDPEVLYRRNLEEMKKDLGFIIERKPSTLPSGGIGVFVTEGKVPANTIVSMYPGVIYQSYDPILLQSIANPFIFRCIDNILIDGSDKKLSRYIYRSCSQRDRHGPYFTCDTSWLTPYPINPLAVGQYVNNQSKRFPSNVTYQEFDIPDNFPFHLLKYIPNIHYGASTHYDEEMTKNRLLRVIVLVSTRQIDAGEELFSTYFTVVR